MLGGLAVRLDLTFEHLEDLQLALAGLLDVREGESRVTVEIRVEGGTIKTSVGPFSAGDLSAQLGRDDGGEVTLARLLATVVDNVAVADRESGQWVELTKSVEAA